MSPRLQIFTLFALSVLLTSVALPLPAQESQDGPGRARGGDGEGRRARRFGEGGAGIRGERGGGFGGGMRGGFGRRAGPGDSASTAPLEMHGLIGRGENAQVSITNPSTGESQWVRVRDTKAKWYVESVNPKSRSAIVRMDGMTLKLEMVTTTGEPMSITPQAVSLGAGAGTEILAGSTGTFRASEEAATLIELRRGSGTGQGPTPEQMQAFGDRMRAMTPEQRTQVFEQFRQMQQAATPVRLSNATAPTATAPTAAPAAAHGVIVNLPQPAARQ
jgi:hypothetical protein